MGNNFISGNRYGSSFGNPGAMMEPGASVWIGKYKFNPQVNPGFTFYDKL